MQDNMTIRNMLILKEADFIALIDVGHARVSRNRIIIGEARWETRQSHVNTTTSGTDYDATRLSGEQNVRTWHITDLRLSAPLMRATRSRDTSWRLACCAAKRRAIELWTMSSGQSTCDRIVFHGRKSISGSLSDT